MLLWVYFTYHVICWLLIYGYRLFCLLSVLRFSLLIHNYWLIKKVIFLLLLPPRLVKLYIFLCIIVTNWRKLFLHLFSNAFLSLFTFPLILFLLFIHLFKKPLIYNIRFSCVFRFHSLNLSPIISLPHLKTLLLTSTNFTQQSSLTSHITISNVAYQCLIQTMLLSKHK